MEKNEITLDSIKKALKRATVDKKHPFCYPVLGTVNKNTPALRTVVLRAFTELPPQLFFHTDFRSPKVQQIKNNNKVSFLFYNPKKRLQLRISTLASLHHKDKMAETYWQKSSANSVKNYAGVLTPSSKIDTYINNLPEKYTENIEKLGDVADAYENFTLVSCAILSIDALLLGRNAHIRMNFEYKNGEWLESYLVS